MLAPFSLSLSLSLVPCPGDEEGGSDGLNYGRRKESTLKRQRRESDVIRKKKKEEEKARFTCIELKITMNRVRRF